jgi:hypothetical protein
MILLYEICIWLAWFDRRKNRVAEEQEARERAERMLVNPHQEPEPELEPESAPGDDYFKEDPYHHSDYSSGDDGWSVDHPQQEFDEIPELPEVKPDAADEVKKRPDEQP